MVMSPEQIDCLNIRRDTHVWDPTIHGPNATFERAPKLWIGIQGGGFRGVTGGLVAACVWAAVLAPRKTRAARAFWREQDPRVARGAKALLHYIPELWAWTIEDVLGAGCSIGALLMLRLSDGTILEAVNDWRGVRKQGELLSVPFDLFQGFINDGSVSMKRAERYMRKRGVAAGSRSIPCWAGVVDGAASAADGNQFMLPVDGRVPLQTGWDRAFCSGTLSPAMEIRRCDINGKSRVALDGGWFFTFPRFPGIQPGDHVIAIWNSPTTAEGRRVNRTQKQVSRMKGHFGSMLAEHVTRNVLDYDMPYLRDLAANGVTVDSISPANWKGIHETFAISTDIVNDRELAALRAIQRGPERLSSPHQRQFAA